MQVLQVVKAVRGLQGVPGQRIPIAMRRWNVFRSVTFTYGTGIPWTISSVQNNSKGATRSLKCF